MRYFFLRFPGGKTKAVTLSYDDGCRDDIRMADTISKYGLKCTFNLTANPAMTKEEIQEHILDKGHEIAVHGAQHRAEGLQRPAAGIKDVLDCRLYLEKTFDRIIRGMAYPDSGITRFGNGTSYETVKQYLSDLGIVYSRTLAGDNNKFELPTDWHAWMPTAHHKNPQIMEYIKEFVELDIDGSYGARRYPRLFYIWGHSFEFERDENWELLDEIAEAISGKEDTWYATNMEIYAYVEAYHALVFSADETKIYNPTLHAVWLNIDGVTYTVKPGETIIVTEG
ncbi:MAG: polysaccharide deacetylase family protein [Clostridia bacterium]|nr:polysaccharide deacetylase family protein [Clostridia bacterium]